MILLTTTSDLLRVVTSSTSALDVQASWVDVSGSTVTPGRTNTLISTATTTTIVASPAASTYRTVKTLSLRNRGAANNTVTIQHSDGTNIPELMQATLLPGYQLFYDEGLGWSVRDTRGVLMTGQKALVNTIGQTKICVLRGDVVNDNASGNSECLINGLEFNCISGQTYFFRASIDYTADATSTGCRVTWGYQGVTTRRSYQSQFSLSTTTRSFSTGSSTALQPSGAVATCAATGSNQATIWAFFVPEAAGKVNLYFAPELSGANRITIKKGSMIQWVRGL